MFQVQEPLNVLLHHSASFPIRRAVITVPVHGSAIGLDKGQGLGGSAAGAPVINASLGPAVRNNTAKFRDIMCHASSFQIRGGRCSRTTALWPHFTPEMRNLPALQGPAVQST